MALVEKTVVAEKTTAAEKIAAAEATTVVKKTMSIRNTASIRKAAPKGKAAFSRKTASASVCVEDRRIARTKSALRDALVELMDERGYDGFTVNDLCVKADLNRGTFYNHYKDKDELLLLLEDEVLEGLSALQPHVKSLSVASVGAYALTRRPLPVLVELFDYLRGQGEFLQIVMGPGGDPSFAGRVRAYVCDNFVLALLHKRYHQDRSAFVDYYIAFYANAYLGVICRWIETGMQEGSEEMARIALRLLFIKPGESIKL